MSIYGDLSFRQRLFRGTIGAILGAGVGWLIAVAGIMSGRYGNSVLLVVAVAVGGAVGWWLAFRRQRVGW